MSKLEGYPLYVETVLSGDSEYGGCFENVRKKIEEDIGEIIYGWQFCEYEYMIEAEFHAAWKSPTGRLIDITPAADPRAKQILFAIDKTKKFDGESTDNFRLNITNNWATI